MATKITPYQIHNEKPNERIASYMMKGRIKDFRNAQKGKYPDGEHYDGFTEWINSYGLCFNEDPENEGFYKLELSYGGPSNGFVFIDNGYVIKYYFAN